ncbi:protein RGF1 INDUCIBLE TRANSCRIPTION FACTOR 1-like [Macadamia integrifolia]|uniref:protein RGF1 INDUCIBLE TRANSCRIPTION FACTOR 1-like n=1 Tax=Macadamia integrifolia TaxID=60698 RepID=UPI001C500496|nr:protein RGF1 INDUCIBLE TRANSCRIPTION FACTOR 1-like [Macadamia integrifolia]
MVSAPIQRTIRRIKRPPPDWIETFLKTKFFLSCLLHQEYRKNEMNLFCINCGRSICQHCICSCAHDFHQQIQIRKYVYHEVVRVDEIEKHVNCSKIQSYLSNLAKVVFLNPRPNLKTSKSNSNGVACEVCDRSLQEPYRYCSIACKLSKVAEKGSKKSLSPPSVSLPVRELNIAESGEESSDQQKESNPSKRKRKRKGTPRRAPLF